MRSCGSLSVRSQMIAQPLRYWKAASGELSPFGLCTSVHVCTLPGGSLLMLGPGPLAWCIRQCRAIGVPVASNPQQRPAARALAAGRSSFRAGAGPGLRLIWHRPAPPPGGRGPGRAPTERPQGNGHRHQATRVIEPALPSLPGCSRDSGVLHAPDARGNGQRHGRPLGMGVHQHHQSRAGSEFKRRALGFYGESLASCQWPASVSQATY
jgi:hypothetical protein